MISEILQLCLDNNWVHAASHAAQSVKCIYEVALGRGRDDAARDEEEG